MGRVALVSPRSPPVGELSALISCISSRDYWWSGTQPSLFGRCWSQIPSVSRSWQAPGCVWIMRPQQQLCVHADSRLAPTNSSGTARAWHKNCSPVNAEAIRGSIRLRCTVGNALSTHVLRNKPPPAPASLSNYPLPSGPQICGTNEREYMWPRSMCPREMPQRRDSAPLEKNLKSKSAQKKRKGPFWRSFNPLLSSFTLGNKTKPVWTHNLFNLLKKKHEKNNNSLLSNRGISAEGTLLML